MIALGISILRDVIHPKNLGGAVALLLLGTGFFIVFGALSDRIGRKPVIYAACVVGGIALLVLGLAVVLVVYGTSRLIAAPLDVFPEFAPPQVSIQTEAPGFPGDVAKQEVLEGLVFRV